MKFLAMMLFSLSVAACSSKTAYVLAQEAHNSKCMDRSNNEEKLECRDGNVPYEEYKKDREALNDKSSNDTALGFSESDRRVFREGQKELERIEAEKQD